MRINYIYYNNKLMVRIKVKVKIINFNKKIINKLLNNINLQQIKFNKMKQIINN